MAIIEQYMTKNPCYTTKRSIKVEGLMLHSIGVPQPNPLSLIKNWNRASFDSACVHGFIGEDNSYITLPCFETPGFAHRAWHAGKGKNGSANNSYIGIEMCEPKQIKYVGGATFTCSNPEAARTYVEKTTRNAVELFAKLCLFHNLNPLQDGAIISHEEGYSRGIASNHGDPTHLWKQLNMDYDMNKFRLEVYEEMNKKEEEDMDVNRFKELWYEMREELQDNDASSWSKEARDWAVKTGLVQGASNSEFNGSWEDLLTREQLVTILYRFAKLMGKI